VFFWGKSDKNRRRRNIGDTQKKENMINVSRLQGGLLLI
jgi:hypothetical protein